MSPFPIREVLLGIWLQALLLLNGSPSCARSLTLAANLNPPWGPPPWVDERRQVGGTPLLHPPPSPTHLVPALQPAVPLCVSKHGRAWPPCVGVCS